MASIERRVQSGPNGKQYGVTCRVRYRGADGRERSKSFKRLRDAKRWASTQTASIAKGEWVDPHQSRITFADWVPQWEHTLHHLRPRTRQLNVGVARNYLLPRFGPKPLDAISRADVHTMLSEELAERHLSNSAIRRHVMVMAQILDAAVQDGRLGRNVASSIRLPREKPRRMRRLTEPDLKRLIAATPSFYRPLVVTAAYLGLRWGEVTGLGVEHLDFDASAIRVERQLQDINGKMQFTQPKTKAGNRAVSVPPSLMAMLGDHVRRPQVKESGTRLILNLQAGYLYPEDRSDDFSALLSMDIATAYRLAYLWYGDPIVLDERLDAISLVLEWDNAVGPTHRPEGMDDTTYENLVLEVQAGRALQLGEVVANVDRSAYLTVPQLEAIAYMSKLFGDEEVASQQYQWHHAFPNGLFTVRARQVNPYITWELATARANDPAYPEYQLSADGLMALDQLWDDIAFSHLLGSSWRDVADFTIGEELASDGERRQSVEDYLIERGLTINIDDLDDEHPGFITTEDMRAFERWMRLALLAPVLLERLDPESDGTINETDVKDNIDRLDAIVGRDVDLPDEALAQEFIRVTTGLNLLDDNFDLRDLATLLEVLGLVVTVAGLMLLPDPASKGLALTLLGVGTAAEGAAGVVLVFDGSYGEALGIFALLLFELPEMATVARLWFGRTDEVVEAVATGGRLVDSGVPKLFGDLGRADLVDGLKLRPLATNVSSGGESAYFQWSLRSALPAKFPALTPAQVRAHLANYAAQVRKVLSPEELARYDRVQAVLDRPGGAEAYRRWGDDIFDETGAVRDDLIEFGDSCRVAASFGADTLVVMADGSRRAISTIGVGDEVLAFDEATQSPVIETVTATLPHTDTLHTAYLSDGSVLSVTEDHLFFDAAAGGWVELAGFGGDMLTASGAGVGLDEFVWSTTGASTAFDLTVSDEHNYFVAADADGTAVLVHNASSRWTCTRAAAHLISENRSLAAPLKALDDVLDPAIADELGAVVELLEELDPVLADRLLQALAQPDQVRALQIAGNASIDAGLTSAIVRSDLADEILGGTRFADLSANVDQVSTFVVRTSEVRDLSESSRRAVASYMFDSNRAEAFVELAVRDVDRATAVFKVVDANVSTYGSMVDDAVALGTPYRVGYVDEVATQIGPGRLSGQINDVLNANDGFEGELLENLNAVHRARAGEDVRFNAETGTTTGPGGQTPPDPTRHPEYWVTNGDFGEFVDALIGASPGNAGSYMTTARAKIQRGQTQRVDIVLDRFGNTVTIDEVEQAFLAENLDDWVTGPGVPRQGRLIELTVLKDGVRRQIYFAPELAG